MTLLARDTLQTATTISKTTQTIMGEEIACGGHEFITLFLSYVNGDETGVDVQVHFMQSAGGTAHQDQSWTAAAGTKTTTDNEYRMTASGDHFIKFDIRGIEFIKFTQGGSSNDGTPTGTLAASYSMTAS